LGFVGRAEEKEGFLASLGTMSSSTAYEASTSEVLMSATPPRRSHSGPAETRDRKHAQFFRRGLRALGASEESFRWCRMLAVAWLLRVRDVHPRGLETAGASAAQIHVDSRDLAWKGQIGDQRPKISAPRSDREKRMSAECTLARRGSCPSPADFRRRELQCGDMRRPQPGRKGKRDQSLFRPWREEGRRESAFRSSAAPSFIGAGIVDQSGASMLLGIFNCSCDSRSTGFSLWI
jgi:hypothetical protein